MSLLRFSEFEPIMRFPDGIDLWKFGNKTLERLSGVISLRCSLWVTLRRADFSETALLAAVVAPATLMAGYHFLQGCHECLACSLTYVCVSS